MSPQSSPPGFNDTFDDTPAHYVFNGKIMVAAIIVLFLVIFIILMIHVYAKWFWQQSSTSFRIGGGITFTSLRAAHINTGLDKAAIAQLPTFIYKAPSSSAEAGKDEFTPSSIECAVCLSEFEENEKGKMLPLCKHTFHTECIDMWLLSHSTCPLCRTSVMPATATSPSHEQLQGGEQQGVMEAAQTSTEGSHEASSAVQYPCNVLFWGNQAQVTSSQDPSSSSSPLPLPLRMPRTRSMAQITIDIPPTEGNSVAGAEGCLSSKSASSTTPKSPSIRASIKRMLSRQSSRQKSSNQEGNEQSPK